MSDTINRHLYVVGTSLRELGDALELFIPTAGLAELHTLRSSEGVPRKLDDYPREIQRLKTLQNELQRVIAQTEQCYGQLRNALAPVSLCPVEILSEIFSEAYGMTLSVDGDPTSLVLSISQVCSEWRAVAASLPPLWTQISARWPHDQQKVWLARSANRAIDIFMDRDIRTEFYRRSDERQAIWTPDLLGESFRWRSIVMNGCDARTLNHFFAGLIESRNLSGIISITFMLPESIQQYTLEVGYLPHLPQLQNLCTRYIPLGSMHKIAPNLVHLSLLGNSIRHSYEIDFLSSSECEHLETCMMSRIATTSLPFGAHPQNYTKFKLRELGLGEALGHPLLMWVLKTLRAPSLQSMWFWIPEDLDPDNDTNFVSYLNAFFASALDLTNLTLRCNDPYTLTRILTRVTGVGILPSLRHLSLSWIPRDPGQRRHYSPEESMIYHGLHYFLTSRIQPTTDLADVHCPPSGLQSLTIPPCSAENYHWLSHYVGEVHLDSSHLKDACIFDREYESIIRKADSDWESEWAGSQGSEDGSLALPNED